MVPRPAIAFGVAGWHYPDWKETVYQLPSPPGQPDLFGDVEAPSPKFASDELAFISQYVDMVEINSSFYRIPSPRSTRSWGERVSDQPGFFFTAKLNQAFTHEFCRDRQLAREFRQCLEPLREKGILQGLLAQFRYDFADNGDARQLVRWIQEQFAELAPLVVEVRHKSWEEEDALALFKDLGIAVANLDYPVGRDSFDLYGCVTAPSSYLRLHGRNREAWFRRCESAAEPYNYDYSDEEVSGLTRRIRDLAGSVQQLTIVANNHYRGKAVSAALRLKAAIEKRNVPVPPALLEVFPGLKRIASSQ